MTAPPPFPAASARSGEYFARRVAQGAGLGLLALAGVVLATWGWGRSSWSAFGAEGVPMAPSTALAFLLLSVGLLLTAHPAPGPGRRAGTILPALVVMGFATLVWLDFPPGWAAGWENRLFSGGASPSGIPLGRMSPVTAGLLALAASALVWLAGPARSSTWIRRLSALLATGTLLGGLTATVGYGVGLPLRMGSGSIPVALPTAVGFLLLGLGLLALATPEGRGWRLGVFYGSASEDTRLQRSLFWGFPVVLVGAVLWAHFQLQDLRQREEENAAGYLSAIAKLQADEIARWYRERQNQAETCGRLGLADTHLANFLAGSNDPENPAAVALLLQTIRSRDFFQEAALLDAEGRLRLAQPTDFSHLRPEIQARIQESGGRRRVLSTDWHFSADGTGIHQSWIVPLTRGGLLDAPAAGSTAPDESAVFGYLVLRCDPQSFVFPFLQRWARSTASGETLLVRRDGDDVLFLTPARHRPGAALHLRQPLSEAHLPAAQAVRGVDGLTQGIDYRGVPVLAYLQPVTGTPWFLVAKIDRAEIEAPVERQSWILLAGIGLLAMVLVSLLTILAGWRDRRLLRQRWSAEKERMAMSERAAHLMQGANDLIFITDQHWRILEANDRAIQATGYSTQELLGKSLAELHPPGSRHELTRQADTLLATGGAIFETLLRRRDGSVFPVESSIRIIEETRQPFHLAILRDITKRCEQDREIHRLTRLYATLSQINQAIVRTDSREHLFQEIPRLTVQFGGFRVVWIGWLEEATGEVRPVGQAGPAEEYLRTLRVSARPGELGNGPVGLCLREHRSVVFNHFPSDPRAAPWAEAARAHGLEAAAAFPVRYQNEVVAALVVYAGERDYFQDKEIALLEEAALDISFALDHLAEKERRREAETRFRALFESSLNGVALHQVVCDADGRPVDYIFLEVNPAFEKQSGISADRALNRRVTEVIPGIKEAPFIERYGQVALTGQPISFECFVPQLGRHFVIQAFCAQHGQFATIFSDITERKQAEAELVRAKEEAVAANRAKDEFLAVISHEMRTPLNPILGFADLLREEIANPVHREYVDLIAESGRKLLGHIQDILNFTGHQSRGVGLVRETFRPADLARQALQTMAGQSQGNRLVLEEPEVAAAGEPPPETVQGDAGKISQVLLNLLTNACKFTTQGQVSLRWALESAAQGGWHLRYEVSDTGPGIDPRHHQMIFQPFSQVDFSRTRSHGGLGLGLALCRRLVEGMGGQIGVVSQLQEGARFWLVVPVQPGAPAEGVEVAPARSVTTAPPASHRPRILVVEDVYTNRRVAETLLHRLGCEPRSVESGRAALDLLARESFDLILLDLGMPDMDGLETLRHIRRLAGSVATIPVVALTAHVSEEMASECRAQGFNDFISKPVTLQKLSLAIGLPVQPEGRPEILARTLPPA